MARLTLEESSNLQTWSPPTKWNTYEESANVTQTAENRKFYRLSYELEEVLDLSLG